jgi:hypothetical protein
VGIDGGLGGVPVGPVPRSAGFDVRAEGVAGVVVGDVVLVAVRGDDAKVA